MKTIDRVRWCRADLELQTLRSRLGRPATFSSPSFVARMSRVNSVKLTVLILALVLGLPLVGALLAGRTMAEFTRFPPPRDIPTDYVHLSWTAVAAVVALLTAVTLSWVVGRRAPASPATMAAVPIPARAGTFPRWGWAALTWTLAWWALAWTRWTWFEPLQRYTFFPLWLGFIVSVNAAIHGRLGSCLMVRAPRQWLLLFGVSAACWWAFEWLNRFVRNWHYLNVEDVGALEYFLHATLCFSTVLPAVAGVAEWLGSHARWNARVQRGPRWAWLARRDTAVVLAVLGCASLVATGLQPQWFYAALWVSPLALQIAATVLSGRLSWVHELARGDWQRVATWMIAALVCGFFWELWNWQSVAKWIYTVPGVERWHLFEMPALGYAGYLPFGLECLLVAEWVIGDRWRAGLGHTPGAQ